MKNLYFTIILKTLTLYIIMFNCIHLYKYRLINNVPVSDLYFLDKIRIYNYFNLVRRS